MKQSIISILTIFLISGLFSCETNDANPSLTIPSVYDGSNFEANAQAELLVTSSLASLATEMLKGRTNGKVDQAIVDGYYKNIEPVTSSYYNQLIKNSLMPRLESASGNGPIEFGVKDGVFAPYLMSKYAVEYEQLIDKGLFAAALYNHATTLISEPLDKTTSDKLLAIIGAHPDFASSNNASLHNNPDRFIANYIARRDKNDGNGFYSEIQKNLIVLQAATKAGSAFEKEQKEAADAILLNWEKGSAATAINYLHSVIAKLSVTNLDGNAQASAMHSFSEVLGFVEGFKTIGAKKITDAQIDELLVLLNYADNEKPKTLEFIAKPAAELPKLVEAINKLKGIYNFTDQEIEDFKKNWISEQAR